MVIIGHPIIGDKLYSNGDGNLRLCSYYLKYYDYFLNQELEFSINPTWIEEME
jgi:23S rRNA-/tRNA-specific pseudouridylate synthase